MSVSRILALGAIASAITAAVLAAFVYLPGGGIESPDEKSTQSFDSYSQDETDGSGGSALALPTPGPVGGGDDRLDPDPAPGEVNGESASGGAAGGVGGVGGAGGGPLTQPQVLDRKIVRNATLEVTVDAVPAAVIEVENIAIAAGGFVSQSSISVEAPEQPAAVEDGPSPTPVPDRQRATVQVRVPAAKYQAVVNDLRAIGEVKAESSNTSEVTEEYTDLEARLRNLEATEQQYLELLNQAVKIEDILTIQDRINSVRLEIEQVKGRLQLLDDMTDLATITVNIALPPVIATTTTPSDPGWAEEAWENAWEKSQEVLETMGAAAITAGVVMVWILVPAVLLGVGWRVMTAIGRRDSAV
jgi:hypothetical protein